MERVPTHVLLALALSVSALPVVAHEPAGPLKPEVVVSGAYTFTLPPAPRTSPTTIR